MNDRERLKLDAESLQRAQRMLEEIEAVPLVRATARAYLTPEQHMRWSISTLGPGPMAVSNAPSRRAAVLLLSDALSERCGMIEHRLHVMATDMPPPASAGGGERRFVRLSRCAHPADGTLALIYEERPEDWV